MQPQPHRHHHTNFWFYELFVRYSCADKFQKYDHGRVKNEQLYGSTMPPEYNLTNIRTKVHVLFGANDWLVRSAVNRIHVNSFTYFVLTTINLGFVYWFWCFRFCTEYSITNGKNQAQCHCHQWIRQFQSRRFYLQQTIAFGATENLGSYPEIWLNSEMHDHSAAHAIRINNFTWIYTSTDDTQWEWLMKLIMISCSI